MRREEFISILARFLKRWWWKIVLMIVVLAAARSSVADWSEVPSTSMEPTILPGDRIYVNKLAYDLKFPFTTRHLKTWGDPRRGEIVILQSPANGVALVKRVVGVPGDRFDLGSGLDSSNLIPPGKYFVAGDNRDHSVDSRSFGLVDRKLILGRAVGVIVSLDPGGVFTPRRGRLFQHLD